MTAGGDLRLRLARPGDAAECLAIYAPVVQGTAISFEFEPPAVEAFAKQIASTLRVYPWLVCESQAGIRGYAYAGLFRHRPAYRWTAETTVYVHAGERGRGVAAALYAVLLETLAAQGLRTAVAGITLPNPASVALHASFGFRHVGTFADVGWKAGAWHSVAFFDLALAPSAAAPSEPRALADVVAGADWDDRLARAAARWQR